MILYVCMYMYCTELGMKQSLRSPVPKHNNINYYV